MSTNTKNDQFADAISQPQSSFAFIDASNLFYGGEKSLGWKIDYQCLANVLRGSYDVTHIFYYAGIRLFGFPFNSTIKNDFPLDEYLKYLQKKVDLKKDETLTRQLKQAKFYRKLKTFGYTLRLKPVREIQTGKTIIFKANCDVDLTFDALTRIHQYKKVIFMSGDGDFLILLKYLQTRKSRENVWIIARGERTAREIRQLGKNRFLDLISLKQVIMQKGEKK
jgi:uncharacterized LabA/DUF88 family protein